MAKRAVGNENQVISADPSLPTRSPTVAGVRVGDEALLYDEAVHRLHLLNPTAAMIWFACDGETSVRTVVAELACAYRVHEGRIAEDVSKALQDLAELGLVCRPSVH